MMNRDDIEACKRRADQLVSSYGAFQLASRFEEAVNQLNRIWDLDPVDLQIATPSKSIAISNAIRKTTSIVSDSGKAAAKNIRNSEALAIGKTKGNLAKKAAGALERTKTAKEVLGGAVKTGISGLKKRPLVALGSGAATAATGFAFAVFLKRQLKTFNENCYNIKLENLAHGDDHSQT